ncbi:MAG: MFS transporter [Acidihalobacter sp.]|uniref:MFS transporter n=1 Tax=Acidihalobacter sp. TaxID=1872108 RepID=UPI00307EFA4D
MPGEGADTDNRNILALAAPAFIGGLGGGVVFPILPLLGLQLGIPAALIGLILSINRIVRLTVNPLTGWVVDRFGARWPLILGLLIEAVSTLCFHVGAHAAYAAAWFLFGRVPWGVGSSLLMIGALSVALMFASETGAGLATAKVRMSLSLGMPAGLVLGGLVAAQASPDAAFLAAAAITFVGALYAWRFAPRGTRPAHAALREHEPKPAVGLRELLRPGPLWSPWLFNFFTFFGAQGVVLSVLTLLVRDRHLSFAGWGVEGTAGALMAMMIGGSALIAWQVGRRIDSSRRKTASLAVGVLLLAGFALLAVSWQIAVAVAALALIGAGLGGINTPLLLIIGELAPAGSHGRAIGIYQVLGDLGGSLGPIIGLEALLRYGGVATLLSLTALLGFMLPLVVVLWRWEMRRWKENAD